MREGEERNGGEEAGDGTRTSKRNRGRGKSHQRRIDLRHVHNAGNRSK